MPKEGPRSKEHRSADSKKLRILSYLYSHSEGANPNTINGLPGLNSQRWDIIIEILNDLVSAGSVVKESHDEIRKGAVIYKITLKGRQTVDRLKELHSAGLGEGFDLFRSFETD